MVTHGNSLFKHIFQKIVRSWDVGLHGHPGNAWLGHTLFQFLKPHKRLILSCMECLAWPLDVLVLSGSSVIESTIFSVCPGWALHVTSMIIVFQKAGTVCGLTTETRNTKMCVHKTLYSCIF